MKYFLTSSHFFSYEISQFFQEKNEKIEVAAYSENFFIGPITKILSDETDRDFQLWKEKNYEQWVKLKWLWDDDNFEENYGFHCEMRQNFLEKIAKIADSDEIIVFDKRDTNGVFFTAFCKHFLGQKFEKAKIILLEERQYFEVLWKKNFDKILANIWDNFSKKFFENFWEKIPENNFLRIFKNGKIRFLPIYFFDSQIFPHISARKYQIPHFYFKKYHELNYGFIDFRIFMLVESARLKKKKWIFKHAFNYETSEMNRHKILYKIKK